MIKKSIKILYIFVGAIFVLVVCGFNTPLLASMQSGNYRIEADDTSGAGGAGSSVNYIFRDTLGEVSTGPFDSTNYKLKTGYQEMLETYLSVSAPNDITLTGTIYGMSGGTAEGTIAWTVIADNSSGFFMQIKSSASPALKLNGDPTYYFADYTSGAESIPDYNWQVNANDAEFGFTVEPATDGDAVQNFLDNASNACNEASGSQTADKCWLAFNGSTYIDVINRLSRTDVDGENESIKFRAQSAGKFLKEGEYNATITVLAAAN